MTNRERIKLTAVIAKRHDELMITSVSLISEFGEIRKYSRR